MNLRFSNIGAEKFWRDNGISEVYAKSWFDSVRYVINSKFRLSVKLSDWINEFVKNPSSDLVLVANCIPSNPVTDLQVKEVQNWVYKNIRYKGDVEVWGMPEHWNTPDETLKKNLMVGDCVAEYEEIYTKNGLKKAKEIELGDEILSYDFESKQFCYKRIINKWNKGELNIKRVHLRNGQHIDITEDHNMLVRTNQKSSEYVKQRLKDIDLDRWWKRKIPVAKKIPYVCSVPIFEKEIYRIIGHYLAEGWKNKDGSIYSSGYELNDYIIPLLEKYDIPHTACDYGDVPRVRFLKSEFRNFLKTLKENSFDIHLSEELITLPEDYLRELLYGLWLGDGTKFQYPDKRGYKNNKEWTFSTSSEQLAKDLQRIHLYLGEPLHVWKQEHHQGLGNQPIFRLNKNSESFFNQDYGYGGLSEVSIKEVEDIGIFNCYDWEVEDTHNFVFANGTITHNCEDGAILMYVLCRLKNVPANRLLLMAGDVLVGKGASQGGHAWLAYRPFNYPLSFVFLDWCYNPDLRPVDEMTLYNVKSKFILSDSFSAYKWIWFACNEEYSFYELNDNFGGMRK
jgi:intein/homing endonuclease